MRPIWYAYFLIAASVGIAQELPLLTARVTVMKFCSQAGIRTVRVHIGYDAEAPGDRQAVIPRLVRTHSATIAPLDETSHHRPLRLGFAPKMSEKVFMKLEEDGGIVLRVSDAHRVVVYGLYLPFFVDKSEAKRAASKPTVILALGKSYRLTADVDLWTEQQYQKWVKAGYVTRKTAIVSAVFAVPTDPNWTVCQDEPRLALPGPARLQRNE